MLLSEEQQLIQSMAREFSQNELLPHAAERDRTGKLPRAVISAMGELGLLGMCVPEEYGGAGADTVSYVLALMEIAAGDGGVSTIMSVQNSPVCAAILGYGNEEQKKEFLPSLANGEKIGAFLLTEPQAGSDAANLTTKATPRDGGYVISGTKQFITSGRIAELAMIFGVTDASVGKRGISCFLAPTRSRGYVIAKEEEKLGQRASDTCQIVLEDLVVEDSMMLGEPGEGYKIALANLSIGRIGIAAQAVGMAQASLEFAVFYAKDRKSFGKPIIELQAVGHRLAEMATEVEMARQGVLHAACLRDSGASCLREASMAKLFASEMAERVCSGAIQTLGGYGYLSDYPVERIYRDVKVCQIYEGTSDIQRMVIARDLAREGFG
ncbi:acyl-CoA dehydrogenase family protein [Myxococcota bacterium]|nr:acyl-CoA dehydrogenase family protein [Myxococcota bacterium]